MRATAATIAGLYALLIMSIALPWEEAECTYAACVTSTADTQFFAWGYILAALAVPTVVVSFMLGAILGSRNTRDPEAGAVLAALGQTRGMSVRLAALQGLRDGAIAVSLAYLITGGIHIAMLVGTGVNPVTTGAEYWGGRALFAVAALLTLVIPHILIAAQRPRTPVEALTADFEEEPAARPSLKVRALMCGGLLAGAAGVIVGIAMSQRDTDWREVGFVATNTAGIAMTVAWVSVLALGLWAAVPWLRMRRASVAGLAMRAARPNTRVGAVLATFAGDRSRASARIVTVVAGLGFLIAAVPSQDPAPRLDPYMVNAVVLEGEIDAAAQADAYRAVEGVDQVIVTQADFLNDAGFHSFVFGVSPDSLRGREDQLADVLDRHPDAVAAQLFNGDGDGGLLTTGTFDASGIVPISACCGTFINSDHVTMKNPGAGFLIYASPEADWKTVSNHVDNVPTPGAGSTGYVSHGSPADRGESGLSLALIVNLALIAFALGLPLTMVAAGAVRRRRHDNSTLMALGAKPQHIRIATALEMAVMSAFAITGGALVGVATRVVMTALQQARLSLGPVIVEEPFMVGMNSVAWGAIAIVALASVVTMTFTAFVTAWIAGRGMRPARKSGGSATANRQSARQNEVAR